MEDLKQGTRVEFDIQSFKGKEFNSSDVNRLYRIISDHNVSSSFYP